MKAESMEVKVYTEEVGILTVILVKDAKEGGYTIFFKEKEWNNITTEGETIDESITNLINLFHVVVEYKKNRKFATDFGEWIWKNNIKDSTAVQGHWYHQKLGYVKDTEALYDIFIHDKMFLCNIGGTNFNAKEHE
jgi:predicted RNase H-like HicB family nuclease